MTITIPDDLWRKWLETDAAYKADLPEGRNLTVEQHKKIVDRLRAGIIALNSAEPAE